MPDNSVLAIKKRLENCTPSKNNPIYNSHIYWSQKAYNVTDIIIQELSSEGDTVFDPFMGSGVTVIESVSDSAKRNAIGVDINEVPLFIVQTAIGHRDSKKVVSLIKEFVKESHQLLDGRYSTILENGNTGTISSVVFDIVDGKYLLKSIKGKNNATGKNFSKIPDELDAQKIQEKSVIENIHDYTLMEDSKLAVRQGEKISEIFTPRNFACLDKLIGLSKEEKYKPAYQELRYVLLSMIHLCKITDLHSNSQWPLWIPNKNCVEKNVLNILDRRSNLTIKEIQFATSKYKKATLQKSPNSFKGTSNFCLFQKGIQDINKEDIPDESVDLIITDPPYLGQVAYSEYMQLYKPFLGFNINYDDEIVVSSAPSREKSTKGYFDLMNSAFSICGKKLKKGKFMCMYFHDCKLPVWDKLITSLSANGFRFLTQVHIEKSLTVKNIISPKKSLNGDALLFFVKDMLTPNEKVGKETLEEITANVIAEAKHMISQSESGLSTPELYDNGLMEFIIHNGWLHPLSKKYNSLVDIFERFFFWDESSAKWQITAPGK